MSLIRFYFQLLKIPHGEARILRGATGRLGANMVPMDLAPATASAGPPADRRVARAKCMVRVKFIGMPIREMEPEVAHRETRASGMGQVFAFLSRVLGRLVAARP